MKNIPCEKCGHVPTKQTGITVDQMRQYCRDNDLAIYPLDLVPTSTAAILLNKSEATLRNWRYEHTGPKYSKAGRPKYPLAGLAEWINSGF